jgi:nitrite reductase (NADH) large subunit
MKYLIIGNGIAGVCAAEAVRELDRDGEIVMVGDETFPPYSRPMIGQVLEGAQPHAKLPIRSDNFYPQWKITPVLGRRVDQLDVDRHRVRITDGTWLGYDRLLIACGADPRPLRAQGLELGKIFYMRTQAHVQQQLDALPGCRQALVLGGGLVGFKAAYGLMRRGLKVTMLITSDYPLAMQVDPIAGKMILDALQAQGLDVQIGISVQAFEGNGSVQAAVTDAGARVPCDLVIIGKGVRPALTFVPRERVPIDLGIVVDDHLQTGVDGVYAAGDVAESMDIARQCRWVNAIWPEAAAQGRIAGLNMAGRPVAYAGSLSRNVIRIFDLDVMTLGYANPAPSEACEVVRAGGPDHGYYRSLVLRDNRLVGAVLINGVEQGGVLRALIERQLPLDVSPRILMSPHFNFSRLLR